MTRKSIREYVEAVRGRYFLVSKKEKGKILDETHHLQPFIRKNPWVLGEGVEIICEKMAIDKSGEMDFLMLDRSNAKPKLLIVEVKIRAEVDVIHQILRYADWFVCNPERAKLRVREYGIESEDIDLTPRLTVVASTICDELVNLAQYIQGFEWDFVEVHRFSARRGLFTTVTHRAARKETPKPWYREIYRVLWEYKEEEIESGKSLLERVQHLAKEKGWEVTAELLTDKDGYGEWALKREKQGVFGIGPSEKLYQWEVLPRRGQRKSWYLWFCLPRKPKTLTIQGSSWDDRTH